MDPDNRLVAAELERRWEAALQQLRQTEEAYHRFQQIPLPEKIPPALRETFQNVSSRLPELWPGLSNVQKKELLRSLIHQVIVKRPVPDRIDIRIVWVSGYYSDHTCLTPIHSERNVSGYDQMVSRVQELCEQGYNDARIAARLTQEGFHSARASVVSPITVQKIRLKRGWNLRFDLLRSADEWDGCWTVNGLANQVGVNESTIYTYIYSKVISPEAVLHEPNTNIYLFAKDQVLVDRLRNRADAHRQQYKIRKRAD